MTDNAPERMLEFMDLQCKTCEGTGIVLVPSLNEQCCGNYRRSGDCCGYPVPSQDEREIECPHCEGE